MNLGSLISRSAKYWGERFALKDDFGGLTFQQLDNRTNQLANYLRQNGVGEGDRVAILSWNRNEIVEVEVALLKLGATRVPINARLSEQEVSHVCQDSQIKFLMADLAHFDAANQAVQDMDGLNLLIFDHKEGELSFHQAVESAPNEIELFDTPNDVVAVNHYTSGSSGTLKAAMQTYGNRKTLLRKMSFRSKLNADEPITYLHVGPITHATGQSIMSLLSLGHTNIIQSRFDVDAYLSTIQNEKVSQTYLVPTMINRILAAENKGDYDLSSLKMIRYGAAPISPRRLREAIEFFGPILNQGYGSGETCSSVTMLTENDHKRAVEDKPELLSSCGRPLFDTEVLIVDADGKECKTGEAGEIVIKGPDVMSGYWNAPELTEPVLKDGYYHTGDVAVADEEGYIFIVDRMKDMIVSGGFNIYPNEVEKALYEHDAVLEACVVGAPDPDMGEVVAAVIVLNKGMSVTADEIADHCADLLGKFKKPALVDFAEELPKNDAGKILRREVRDQYWQNSDRKV